MTVEEAVIDNLRSVPSLGKMRKRRVDASGGAMRFAARSAQGALLLMCTWQFASLAEYSEGSVAPVVRLRKYKTN